MEYNSIIYSKQYSLFGGNESITKLQKYGAEIYKWALVYLLVLPGKQPMSYMVLECH